MNKSKTFFSLFTLTLLAVSSNAAVITVTTTANPGAGSLFAALSSVQSGDVVQFNISGAGPHYILTPAGGYPYITANNVTIDGYSQPGAVPNSNPILSSNNAQIKIVLDSRNGNSKLMDFPGDASGDDSTGYGDTESAILGILGATNVNIRGLCLLAVPLTGPAGDVALYGVSFAKAANGHVNGCWIGVDLGGQSGLGYGPADGVTGFRYQDKDGTGVTTNNILVSGVTIGVAKGAANARAEFNVISSIPAIPIIIEGDATRIAGNFINVLPDGLHDYDPAFDPAVAGNFEGNIEIGRGGNNTLIGTDGDGVNDADERNIFSGAVSPAMSGYDHNIEFYGQNPGTNIIVAGNYIGVGIDGTTRFTNNVPPLNAAGGSAQFRFGSDFDGVSDQFEGNVVYNNWPSNIVTDAVLSFFDELSTGASASLRGNKLVNNYTPPVDPQRDSGSFMTNYYAKVVADVNNGLLPVLDTNSSVALLKGTVPVPNTNYPTVIVDVYIPDPEGIATGKAVDAALYPDGWVQGKTYLGSFVVDGPGDLNPAAGAFEFDISSLNVPLNTQLTVTANYSKSPAGTHNADTVTSLFSVPVTVKVAAAVPAITSVTRSSSDLTITWLGGIAPYQVQKRTSLTAGAWQNDGAPTSGNTATVIITGGEGYYRVQSQ